MDLELILKAASFAAEAHATQFRKGLEVPYINHPIRVALSAQRCGLSSGAIAAALLHDVVEDTPTTIEEISAEFPPRVVELVTLLTKWWPEEAPKEVKERELHKYYAAILEDAEAIDLKLLDRADNLGDMVRMVPKARKWTERYLKKTDAQFPPIVAASRNERAKQFFAEAVTKLRDRLAQSPNRPSF